MANIKDVARAAQVSVSTVSRVVNGSARVAPEKRKAVLEALDTLNYQPNSLARALVNRRSNTIGLMVGELGSPFFSQLMSGADQVAVEGGRSLMMMSGFNDAEREEAALSALQQRQCDALIIHAKGLSDERLQAVAKGSTPVIFVNRLVPGFEHRSIYLDNVHGAYLATRHLLGRGHRKIAFIRSNLDHVADVSERLSGYRKALEEFDVTYDEAYVVSAFPNEDGGNEAMSHLLETHQDFTAVMAYNDVMAAGAIGLLLDSGFEIPNDVSIVGFDDVVITKYLRPRLTTIHYPIEEMGRTAARLALQILDNKPELKPEQLKFNPRLVVRNSVRTQR
ncbi:LacI family DNA-binding transcriptional regulator [Natronospirillum operosum]|uniref:LacI family DNA-binding transcriptional regulator n=1 Tax=Natronospirillum operosum TaxID=2759953 RepID=A0A4Z0WA15_9GAMM|nr:substrate-binding domain-containing protein [Natronospirillum operosum]TGG95469.1 LacI family DNA-binding transcriptional regulator [Natronospirillum operosum]